MAKRSQPTASNSGMKPNSLLKYGILMKKAKLPNTEEKQPPTLSHSESFTANINPLLVPVASCSQIENSERQSLFQNQNNIDSQSLQSASSQESPVIKISTSIFESDEFKINIAPPEEVSGRNDVALVPTINSPESPDDNLYIEQCSATPVIPIKQVVCEVQLPQDDENNDSDMMEFEYLDPVRIKQDLQDVNEHGIGSSGESSQVEFLEHTVANSDTLLQHEKTRNSSQLQLLSSASLSLTQNFPNPLKRKQPKGGVKDNSKKRREPVPGPSSSMNKSRGQKGQNGKREPTLEKLIEYKRWDDAIPKIIENIDERELPTPFVLAQMIQDCVLKQRRLSSKAHELIRKLSEHATSTNYNHLEFFLLETVAIVSAEIDKEEKYEENCYWLMFVECFQKLIYETNAKKVTKMKMNTKDYEATLSFLDGFVTILEKLSELYLSQALHLRPPIVARIFEGLLCDHARDLRHHLNVKSNIGDLINFLIQLRDELPEMDLIMRIVSMLVRLYSRCKNYKTRSSDLIEWFATSLQDQTDYGIKVIARMRSLRSNEFAKFASDICCRIICNRIEELKIANLGDRELFLEWMQNTRMIKYIETDENTIPSEATKNLPRDSLKKMGGAQYGGESILHKLCSKQAHKYGSLDSALNIHGSNINVPDSGGNVPLHDAVANGLIDQLEVLDNRCSLDGSNGKIKIYPLHQNNQGNTPLHLAMKKPSVRVIRLLLNIVGDKLERNLYLRNNDGDTPLDLSKRNPLICDLLCAECVEPASWETDFRFPDSKVILSEESVAKITQDRYLQQVIAYYNHFANIAKSD